jgi:hypothetical protein
MPEHKRNCLYKILRPDLSSVSAGYGRHRYSAEWSEVDGNGAYCASSLPGLLAGGIDEPSVLAEIEAEWPTCVDAPDGVICMRRVRVLRHAAVDRWHLVRAAIFAARLAHAVSPSPERAQAIAAAGRCERERTPEAARAASRAAARAAARARERASSRAAARAAAGAARAAAGAARAAARAATWAAARARERASSWAAARAAAVAARAAAGAAAQEGKAMEAEVQAERLILSALVADVFGR